MFIGCYSPPPPRNREKCKKMDQSTKYAKVEFEPDPRTRRTEPDAQNPSFVKTYLIKKLYHFTNGEFGLVRNDPHEKCSYTF